MCVVVARSRLPASVEFINKASMCVVVGCHHMRRNIVAEVDGGGELEVEAEGALLAYLEAEAELGDIVEPDGVDVEGGVMAGTPRLS